MRYAIFGHTMGNLGHASGARRPMTEWAGLLNTALGPSGRVVATFRHTGNFLIDSDLSTPAVCEGCAGALNARCGVLPLAELEELLPKAQAEPSPRKRRLTRWTPGLAFRIEAGQPTGRGESARVVLLPFGAEVVFAWKKDALTPSGTLDRANRRGGWGGVAADVGTRFGGVWTARSLSTVVGLLHAPEAGSRA